jgi:pimeloyl-ACP methyl ester carboxylesterase
MTPAATVAPPDFLETLLERFDSSVFHSPRATARIRLEVGSDGAWDALVEKGRACLVEASSAAPDSRLIADAATWRRIARDVRGGMVAFQQGRLRVRLNLHLGVALLAATSASREPGRLKFGAVDTRIGELSYVEAGTGPPVLALHGLGGTKASFLPTLADLAASHRVVALDLPGFGESAKPIGAPYDARFMARSVVAAMDGLDIDSAHLVGNSMGGRVALEAGMSHPDRVERLALLCPAVAWLRDRRYAGIVRLLRPELGLLQVTPRPVVEGLVRRLVPGATNGWAAAGVDEFLRSYLTPRGRAAFYAAARNIYLDEPDGDDGFWTRLSALERDCLFIWGARDGLVPAAFRRHVEERLPRAEHLVLPCGHVPQVEAPRATHGAILRFLAG